MLFRTLIIGIFLGLFSAITAAAEPVLVMVEEKGCVWCARWNDEISHIYPNSNEGKAAPLLRIDVHAERPEGIVFARGLNFTPTFVLVIDGTEVSRIEGYPGEDFFWGFLAQMLSQANIDVAGRG
ncbi:hypothetical protein [Sedimentitalea todarodis]|uniref:Thioredoxin family protein n=1 Tax=Sedimentitalea todarodis TaxID=1631240 RepID=A0ABU3VH68_9RHOB|nr:hypothetical protein [Sedimentitalea todarodis]MDU9005510.1 hypothetical protein [Sedimentitalea todarodis]